MKSYPEIYRAFYGEPLSLEEGMILSVHHFLWPRMTGQHAANEFEAMATAHTQAPASNRLSGGAAHMRRQMAGVTYDVQGSVQDHRYYWSADGRADVAVIPVCGMLVKGAGSMSEFCMGAVNPDRIGHALRQAMESREVKSIVFDGNSPGGRTAFMPELAAQMHEAAQKRGKTLYWFSDQQSASAAVRLSTQCNETIITPSASVGSIGTYMAFLNPTIAMQTAGYRLEMFRQGTHKAIGVPGRELTQEDRAYLQAMVDKDNEGFVADVKRGRKQVSEEALRDAKMYVGADAIKQGLADGIVSSWDEFVSLI